MMIGQTAPLNALPSSGAARWKTLGAAGNSGVFPFSAGAGETGDAAGDGLPEALQSGAGKAGPDDRKPV
ncbi:hypothetical protein [Azospirillum agricola]|uniref:hypothetical protein n=1 Tax=Azospirillum agricola TaxID=1720247 RepID=UPI0011789158|nr:hypothetical protein [Azospirillum agricola]